MQYKSMKDSYYPLLSPYCIIEFPGLLSFSSKPLRNKLCSNPPYSSGKTSSPKWAYLRKEIHEWWVCSFFGLWFHSIFCAALPCQIPPINLAAAGTAVVNFSPASVLPSVPPGDQTYFVNFKLNREAIAVHGQQIGWYCLREIVF